MRDKHSQSNTVIDLFFNVIALILTKCAKARFNCLVEIPSIAANGSLFSNFQFYFQ